MCTHGLFLNVTAALAVVKRALKRRDTGNLVCPSLNNEFVILYTSILYKTTGLCNHNHRVFVL